MSLTSEIAHTRAQLADARTKGQAERIARLERRLQRLTGRRHEQRVASSKHDSAWSHLDPAVFRKTR